MFLAFAGLGATGAAIPATVPVLAQAMTTDAAALVRVVPALFLGLFVGVTLSPVVARRPSLPVAVAGGAMIQAGALALLAGATTTSTATVAAAAAGVGFGLVESLGAALGRLLAAAHTRLTLTRLTAVTAAVATFAPLVVVAGGAASVRLLLAGAAVLHVLAAVVLVGRRDGSRNATDEADEPASSGPRRASRRLAGALFCYVGSETVVSGWSAVVPQAQLDLSPADAAVGTSLFWLLLMLGRVTGSALLARRADPRVVLVTCQAVCVALLVAATTAGSPVRALVLLGAAVVFMGPCYALLLGAALQMVDADRAPRTSAFLVAAGALGGAVWSAGAALHAADSGWILATACVAMALSTVCALRTGPPRRRARRSAGSGSR